MNLDLLKKLVKLANHNPNDNEANSAARRVCKLIEEGEFNFSEGENNYSTKSTRPMAETWADIIRNAYPDFSSQRGSWEVFTREKPKEPNPDRNEARPHHNPFTWIPYEYIVDDEVGDPMYEYFKTDGSRADKSNFRQRRGAETVKRKLKCTKCQAITDTIFMGLPDVFVCNECIWNDYLKNRVKL